MKKLFTIIVFLSLTVSCSTTRLGDKEKSLAYGEYIKTESLESIDKIRAFKFSGWQPLSNNFLIITSYPDKHLVELNNYCQELMFTDTIVIHQGGDSSLNVRFDYISSVDRMYAKCFIKSIYPVTKEQVKAILAIGSGKTEE